MNILFITATRLGDAVLSTGILAHLRAQYPDARFTIACGPVAAGLFEHLPGRVRTIVVTKRRYDLHWLSLWAQCVRTRWDLVIDLRGSGTSFFLWASRRMVMRGGRRSGPRIGHLGQLLGLDPAPQPTVWISRKDEDLALDMLPHDDTIKLIGIGPTANWAAKVWPAHDFVAMFEELRTYWPNARPVIFYGPGETERAMARPVLDALTNAIDAGGDHELPQVAAMLARCALFVGNDSGLMHLAAATGTPTLGLFGPSRASEYAPTGRRAAFVVAPGEPGQAPIEGLSVGVVSVGAIDLLEGHRAPTPGSTL